MNLNLKKQSSLWIIALVILATVYNVIPSIIYYSHDTNAPLERSQVEKTAQFQLDKIELIQERQETWLKQAVLTISPKATLTRLKGSSALVEIRLPDKENENPKISFEQSLSIAQQFQHSYFPPVELIATSNPKIFLIALTTLPLKQSLQSDHLSYIKTEDSDHLLVQNFKNEWKNQIEERLRSDMSFMAPARSIEYFATTESSKMEGASFKEALTNWTDFYTSAFKPETKKRWSQWVLSQFHSPETSLKEAIDHLTAWQEAQAQKETSSDAQENSSKEKTDLLEQAKLCLSGLEKLKKLDIKNIPDFFHPIVASVEIDNHAFRMNLNLYVDAIASKGSPSAEALELKLFEISSILETTNLGKWSISSTNIEGQWGKDCDRLILWNLKTTPSEELFALRDLISHWKPVHPSLQNDSFKILTLQEYLSPSTKAEDKITCLVLDTEGLVNSGSHVYQKAPQILFKGFELLSSSKEKTDLFRKDVVFLISLLKTRGYDLLPQSKPKDLDWTGSALFCQTEVLSRTLQAPGLDWQPLGLSPWISLCLNDYGTWARTLNSTDDKNHAQLVQSIEDIQTSKNQIKPIFQSLVIVPKANVTWENFKLSWRKIFRGDSKKIVKWGLDLSGGRTVRVALTDEKGDNVTDHEMLLQARNELIQRVNRMGLSEVAARVEGNYLVLDFPSSQGFSSKELIQATRLSFHVVNEKFSSPGSAFFNDTQEFLNQVWSQAQIGRQVDKESLNKIAVTLLEKASKTAGESSLKRLIQAGLTINARYSAQNASPDQSPSMIVPVFSSKRPGQIEQLLIVFSPNALQGSDLSEVRASFDPQHGNVLTFEVRSWNNQGSNPQELFHMWTKTYSQEEGERDLLNFTQGRGWRMAVIMNDEVISSPTLSVGLKDRAMVHGRFTQREVTRLAADIKAGSLTFSPKILSEENISPELGLNDRQMGIQASLIAMIAVGVLMIAYYGFAGVIAFAAVLVNLFIIWAVLQNLGAALTLPGLAGIVLTVGMAVDANVLVFERMREELRGFKGLKEAVRLGYERAFSAIVDSNLTTILAAVILIQFDSGPVKGFAISLIIGIASSMFTALFMTRVFFEKWSSRPGAVLKLRDWIGQPKVSFLKHFTLFTTVSALIAVSGLGILVQKRHEVIGMDFVGGYGFYLETNPASSIGSKEKIINAFKAANLKYGSFDVRELADAQHLKVYLSHALDESDQLFHGLTQEQDRIQKVIDILPIKDLEKEEMAHQMTNSWNAISGQLSQTMRNQAFLGLALALLGILAYLTVRFEWAFAVTGVIALLFDVVLSIGCMGWLKAIGIPMQFDLQAIGAIMTIIGYALNDKIIVFDRIREEKKGHTLNSISIETALRQTLSRTLMTSCTTLVVLFVLDILGGPSLLSFSMIMTLGVLIGTVSSLWFAPWILNKISHKTTAK